MLIIEKPDLWRFLKAKLVPFAGSSEYILSRDGSVKYTERRKTVRLSYLLYLFYALLLFYLVEIMHYKIHTAADFILQLVLFYVIAFLLEALHWLFAKFDHVKV